MIEPMNGERGALATALVATLGFTTPECYADTPIDQSTLNASLAAVHGRLGRDAVDLDRFCEEVARISGTPNDAPTGFRRLEAALENPTARDILEETIGRAVNRGLDLATDSTEWVTTRPIENFREQDRDAKVVMGRLKPLVKGGEVQRATPTSDAQATYKAARFATGVKFDAQDMIDDIVNVLRDTPSRMGAQAVATRVDLVYALLLAAVAGGEFFTEGENRFTADLTVEGLESVMAPMSTQTERPNDGEHPQAIDCRPTHLIVPASKELTARSVLRQLEVNGEAPLSLVVEPRLDVGCTNPITGKCVSGAPDRWFLAASQIPGLEVGKRTERPQLRSYRTTFADDGSANSDFSHTTRSGGMTVEVSHDFGATLCDRRGIYAGGTAA